MISKKARGLSSDRHYLNSLDIWKEGEKLFALATGLEVVKGVKNMRHIDFVCNGELGIFGNVDVKGYKNSHKQGIILVEMLNVQGKAGWCSKDSEADFIALLFEDHFLVVPKMILRGIVLDKCPKFNPKDVYRDKKVKAKEGLYKWIGRRNRKDAFTYIKKEDLAPYMDEIIMIEV